MRPPRGSSPSTRGPTPSPRRTTRSWVALRAVLETIVAGAVAINPQMYYLPGDPLDATPADTRRRRRQEIADIEAGAASGRWDAEGRAGDRPWAAQWLDGLVATQVQITMLFGAADDGLEFLRTRHGRRLGHAEAAGLEIHELADRPQPPPRLDSRHGRRGHRPRRPARRGRPAGGVTAPTDPVLGK
jgi:hypothetical protein